MLEAVTLPTSIVIVRLELGSMMLLSLLPVDSPSTSDVDSVALSVDV